MPFSSKFRNCYIKVVWSSFSIHYAERLRSNKFSQKEGFPYFKTNYSLIVPDLYRLKNIQLFVLLLFIVTSAMQGVLPVLNYDFSYTHSAKHCDSTSCSTMEKGKCMCKINSHHNQGEEHSEHHICGCSHHDDTPTVFSNNIQAKAILVAVLNLVRPVQDKRYISSEENDATLYAREVFHPPRILA